MADTNRHTEPHVLPLSVYLTIGGTLLVLTAITVAVSFFHFGAYNLVVAMVIAAVKASLVALFFMHLKYDSKVYLTVFLLAILFVAVFIILTMADTMERDQIYRIKAEPISDQAIIYRRDSATDSLGVAVDTIGAGIDSSAGETSGH
jgi:cytochrome c oxidase subunit 4